MVVNIINKLLTFVCFSMVCCVQPYSETTQASQSPDSNNANNESSASKSQTNETGDNLSAAIDQDIAPDIAMILQNGVLRVGMCTIDQPPFHVKNADGSFSGFDVNFAQNLASALKVRLIIVEASDWDHTVESLYKGETDLIVSNLTSTPDRATKICFSIPYAKIRQCMLLNRVLLARAGGHGLLTLRQVLSQSTNRRLVIQEGTAYVTSVSTTFPDAEIQTTKFWEDIMKQILSKESIGTISDELEIKQQLRRVHTMELLSVILKDKFDRIVVGVPRNSTQLLHFVNTFIETNGVSCSVED
jgi:ABC-type amino acid transport substrate-binding protein